MSLRGHHKVTTAVVQTARLLVVRFGKQWCAVPSQGVRGVLTVEGSVASRDGVGGTAAVRVAEQRARLTERVRILSDSLFGGGV